MTESASKPQTRAIVVEDVLPHAPEKVWEALTSSAYIERWLMKNDFKPEVGHKFTFTSRPMGDWDGTVRCEVLECDPPHKLVYSWVGGSLDSVLSITLTPTEVGTRLKLVHDGFVSPQNDGGFQAMSGGWASIPKRIDALLSGAA